MKKRKHRIHSRHTTFHIKLNLAAKNKAKQIKLGIVLVLIVAVVLLVLSNLPRSCKDDECFNARAFSCKKTKAVLENDKDINQYLIRGKKNDNCILRITKIKVDESKSIKLREALEGRKMDCAVPMNIVKSIPIKNIANINDYCTGPLKEAVLEISLQKMYEIIVKDLGNVSLALQAVIQNLENR